MRGMVLAVLLAGAMAVAVRGQDERQTDAVNAARGEVVSLFQAGRYAEAEAAGKAALDGNPGAASDRVSALRLWVGHALRRQGRHAAAAGMYRAALEGRQDYQRRGNFHSHLALSLRALGEDLEEQQALMEGLLEAAPRSPLPAGAAGMFGRLRPRVLGTEAYREFLVELLLACPATEENAEFLGRVKSEIEKLR